MLKLVVAVGLTAAAIAITAFWWPEDSADPEPAPPRTEESSAASADPTPTDDTAPSHAAETPLVQKSSPADPEAIPEGADPSPEFDARQFPFLGQRSLSRAEKIALEKFESAILLDASEFRPDTIMVVAFENGDHLDENTKRVVAAAHFLERAEYYTRMDELLRTGEGKQFESSEDANDYLREQLAHTERFVTTRAGDNLVVLDESKITGNEIYQDLVAERDRLAAQLGDGVRVRTSLHNRAFLAKSQGQ